MTTGNRVDDKTSPVVTSNGASTVGGKWTKSWSGEDYPRTSQRREKVWYQNPFKEGTWRFYKAPISPPKRARIVEHPYSCSFLYERDAVHTYCGYIGVQPFYTATVKQHGGWSDSQGNVSHWTSNDDLILLGKLREKLAGSDFNAGVFLGEGKEALSMITNGATRIFKGISALKKGNLFLAANYLAGAKAAKKYTPKSGGLDSIGRKSVSNNWLELQYGWLPLLQDIHGAAQFLAHNLNFPLQHVVKVRRSVPGGSLGPAWGSAKFARTSNVASCQIKAIISEKSVAQLSGLLDPASVAWELLPYSFVVDWFIPIGNYLQNRALASSLTGQFVISKRWKEEGHGYVAKDPNSTTFYLSGDFDCARGTFSRTVSNSLSVPFPSFKPLGKVASWRHCANAVALLSQLKR